MGRAKLFHSRIVSSNNLMQISIADLLKKLSLKHCNTVNITNPGIALSKILVAQCQTSKLKMELNIAHFEKEKIYQTNQNPNNFQLKLQIDSMDVPLLYKLLTRIKAFPTYLKNQQNLCRRPTTNIFCCGQCSHLCNLCNKEECLPNCQNKINNVWDHPCQNCAKTKSQCIGANCTNCVNTTSDLQCGVYNLTDGVRTSKKNRNTSFHLTLFECQNFIQQQTTLNGFPQCGTEKELFQLIRKSFASIVNFLSNEGYFKGYALKFTDRHERIKDMNIILFGKEGEISRDVARNLSRQCLFLTEHIQKLQSEVSNLQVEEEYNAVRLLLFTYCHKQCQLLLKRIKVTGISKVKIFQHSYGKIKAVSPDECDFEYDDVGNASIVKIVHQIDQGCVYDYELIIKDEQESEWKASVEQLDPFDVNYVELKNARTNNKLIKVACNESNIDNELFIIEKIPLGFKASFNVEQTDCIEAVEFRKVSSPSWSKLDVPTTCQQKEDQCLLECQLPLRGIYNFRVLIKTSSHKYRFITLDGIEIVDENSLQHTSSCSQTMLMFHPYGECNDVHRELVKLPRQKANIKGGMSVSIQPSAGGVATRDIDELDNYIEQNFQNQNLITFPPLYMISKGSSYYQIVKRFQKYYRNRNDAKAIILAGADFCDNLLTLGVTNEAIAKLCNDIIINENVIVFDSNINTVFVINICTEEEATAEALKHHHRQCNISARLFLTINQHIIGRNPMAIVGIVACLNGRREVVRNMMFDCENCFQQTLTKDDLQSAESFSGWFDDLNLKVMENFNYQLGKIEKKDYVFKDIPNRLLLLSAIKNFSLPATSVATEEEIISRLVLNDSQINAVYDEKYLKKVIKGDYGSGKTLVLKKSLQILATATVPNIVYYILFDSYSMANMEILDYLSSIPNSTPEKVIVKNIYQLSDEANAKNVFTLSECLKYITKVHPDETTHVLVDEYDEEELTQIQASDIRYMFTNLVNFKDATVVISVQSVEKHSTKFDKNQMPIKGTPAVDWKTAGMETYKLSHTMRSTNNITRLVGIFQKGVAEGRNDIYLPMESTEEVSKKPRSSLSELRSLFSRKHRVNSNDSINVHLVPSTSTRHITGQIESSNISNIELQAEKSIDTIAATSLISSHHTLRMQRSFTFIPSKPGHKVIGTLPKLLRLENSSYIDASIVDYYIRNYCFNGDHQRKALFICNEINLTRAFDDVFKLLRLDAFHYFDSIDNNERPSFERQKTAYDVLIKDDDKNIILTDIRGCRGLEYRKVICVVDESNQYERHMLVEGLTRATSQIYILSIRGERNETNISKIIDYLVAEGIVDNVTKLCTEGIADIKDRKVVEIEEYDKKDESDVLKKKYIAMTSQSDLQERDWKFEDFVTLIKKEEYTKVLHLISVKPSRIQLRGRVDGFPSNNYSLLHSASRHSSNVEFVQRLINAGCSLKEMNGGWMAIHMAAAYNHVDIVGVLLDNDPSLINEENDAGMTPLHCAAYYNRKDVVDFLLTRPNVDVNLKSKVGKMADAYGSNDEIKTNIKQHLNNNS